jgi:ethanolamine utilization protein EutN
MIICKVVGHVWATKKEDNLNGLKLMIVQECYPASGAKSTWVAADVVGAGIGEKVLVVSGSTARKAFGADDIPADMAIVGIIDSLEISDEFADNGGKEATV